MINLNEVAKNIQPKLHLSVKVFHQSTAPHNYLIYGRNMNRGGFFPRNNKEYCELIT